jgi:hypothetical protein
MDSLICAEDDLGDHGFSVLRRIFTLDPTTNEKIGRFYKVYNSLGQIAYVEIDIEAKVKNCNCDLLIIPSCPGQEEGIARNTIEEENAYLRGSYKLMQPETHGAVIEEYDIINHALTGFVTISANIERYKVVNSLSSLDPVRDPIRDPVRDHSIAYPLFNHSVIQKHDKLVHQSLNKVSDRLSRSSISSLTMVKNQAIDQLNNLVQSFNNYLRVSEKKLTELKEDRSKLLKYQEIYETKSPLSEVEYEKYLQIPPALMQINQKESVISREIVTVLADLHKIIGGQKLLEYASH